jgi:hypothetical protein
LYLVLPDFVDYLHQNKYRVRFGSRKTAGPSGREKPVLAHRHYPSAFFKGLV